MSDPSNYTVGWICAISTEYVAAQAFLDQKHEGPEYVSPNDNNDYTLGSIGKHNVVIAVLPDGEYETASAASVARDMLHSFPNIRIGLMVGIGGGVPSPNHDVRLGDIVVSAPRDGKGGVFQYDFGKTIQGQCFHNTRFLDQPSSVLRAAINRLKTRYESDGHQLEEAIQVALGKKPRLRKRYNRPDTSTDRLYKAEILHDDEACCATALGNDTSGLVPRPVRTDDDDNPAIHYGLIASANQLMKDALVRDRLSKEMDILCFEMEAAGLMNHFPCLVIRGICDYSDTHKNKEWQGYAAMAAAAYAKELLNRIAPTRVEAERMLSEVVQGLADDNPTLEGVKIGVETLNINNHLQKLRNWLSPPDPSTNFNKALKQRHQGSGQWFLRGASYTAWKRERNSFLWLHGSPGCGKTVLSSAVVEDLNKSDVYSENLLYFYFDFSDVQKLSLENAVCSLIDQLYCKSASVRKQLDSLYSFCDNGRQRPSIDSLCATFQNMLQQAGEVWIVLDALDECRSREIYRTGGILPWVQSLRDSQMNVHLLVTSRPEQDIKEGFEKLGWNEGIIPLQSDLIGDDIRGYVQARVRQSGGLERWHYRPDIQNEIEAALIQKANGMFRWVACQLDTLEYCLGPQEVREALASLPNTLDETYARILESIPSEHFHYTKRILQFLSFSERPLQINEAVDAIAIEASSTPRFDPQNRLPVPEDISRYCSSLVVVVTRKRVSNDGRHLSNSFDREELVTEIQLAHFSVKEYLTSDRLERSIAKDFEETFARATIAELCIAYLLDLDQTFTLSEIRRLYPMAQYSAEYWASHAVVAETHCHRICDMIMELFSSKDSFETCWKLYSLGESRHGADIPSALYYASRVGLTHSVQMLLHMGANVNARGGEYGNALQAASERGHDKIVHMLLEKGANVDARGGQFGNALCAASYGGHSKIVQMLLETGAEVNSKDNHGRVPLSWASQEGHEAIVKLLLKNTAVLNSNDEFSQTPLWWAARYGHNTVVQLLLAGDAIDPNAYDVTYCGTPLWWAAQEGHEVVVKSLLDSVHVDPNFQNIYGQSPLSRAAQKGHENVVALLLAKPGVDINSRDTLHGRTALSYAAAQGHETVVKLLIEKGVDADCKDSEYQRTPLSWAAENGHTETVEHLLSVHGVDPVSRDKYGRTPLSRAAENGHEGVIIQLLAINLVDFELNDSLFGRTPLSWAAENGHEKVVERLHTTGVFDPDHLDKFGQTPLSLAAENGHEALCKLLFEIGVDLDSKDTEHGRTPLSWAAGSGHEAIVKLLLERGIVDADSTATANHCAGRTPLSWAAENGHEATVKLLLETGTVDADSTATANRCAGRTPLSYAAERGHETVVVLLLGTSQVNADSKATGDYCAGRTPLSWAAENGHEAVVMALLDEDQVNLDSSDEKGRTPLSYAAQKGQEVVVQLLLETRADAETRDSNGRTPLLWAAESRHKAIVRHLLERGANVNAEGGFYGHPLQAASYKGYDEIVQLLLEKGGNVSGQGGKYGSALQAASYGGHANIVHMLIEEGADVDAQGGYYGNALQAASFSGHDKIVRMLLEKGADVNSQGGQFGNALQAASSGGHNKIVQTLLKKGANVDAQGGCHSNAIQAASSAGHDQIVQMLLEAGASKGFIGEDHTDKTNVPHRYGDTKLFSDYNQHYTETDNSRIGGSSSGALNPKYHTTSGPEMIKKSLQSGDNASVRTLVETQFHSIAREEFSWLLDLDESGHTRDEIADLICQQSSDSPWIYFDPSPVPLVGIDLDAHIDGCAHRLSGFEPQDVFQSSAVPASFVQDENCSDTLFVIQELLGLAGIVPDSRDKTKWNGDATFKEENSVAEAWFLEDDNFTTRTISVLEKFFVAAGQCQLSGLCCDSFTILRLPFSGSASGERAAITASRIRFSLAMALHEALKSGNIVKARYAATSILDLSLHESTVSEYDYQTDDSLHLVSLAVQLLCLGFLSYSQAHVGKIQPFFLDAALEHVKLLGNQSSIRDYYIEGSLAELSCLSQMIGGPVFTFRLAKSKSSRKSVSTQQEYDLSTNAEDLIDTWGPGHFISRIHGDNRPFAVAIGDGIVWATDLEANKFHWSRNVEIEHLPNGVIEPQQKMTIGALISVNPRCTINEDQCRMDASSYLHPYGGQQSHWVLDEIQYGMQAGNYVLIQANASRHRVPGRTLKQYIRLQREDKVLISYLRQLWGLQVSFCTGVARRVPLREVIADMIPMFRDESVQWAKLAEHKIDDAFRSEEVLHWLERLPIELTQEVLKIVRRIFNFLDSTGMDGSGKYMVVAWPRKGDLSRCFKIRCERETEWIRILADSDDCATFAYVSTQCFETERIKCCGPYPSWRNRIPLLETAVLLQSNSPALRIALEHQATYFFEKLDRNRLFVTVERPVAAEVANLVAKSSSLPAQIRQRLYVMRWNERKKRQARLRERVANQDKAEEVAILAQHGHTHH